MDMEFYQFHPTALRLKCAPTFLLSEAMRGEGAVLRDEAGRAFMPDYHPLADLAPRDVVSRAIASEMEKANSESVFLDVSHLPSEVIQSRFPTIYHFCLDRGVDITKEPAPVAPAAHYMMGGIQIDTWGRTSVPGLFACGEAACSAVHGANRLAAIHCWTRWCLPGDWWTAAWVRLLKPTCVTMGAYCFGACPTETRCAPPCLAEPGEPAGLCWRNVGINRNGSRLLLTARILNLWQRMMPSPHDRASWELCNMTLLARLMVESALARQESRGSHFRQDFPETRPDWEKHVALTQEEVQS